MLSSSWDLLVREEDLDKGVERFEKKLVDLLNNHVKVTRVTLIQKDGGMKKLWKPGKSG